DGRHPSADAGPAGSRAARSGIQERRPAACFGRGDPRACPPPRRAEGGSLSMTLLIASLAVLVATGLLGAGLSRWPRWATGVGAAGALAGCALGLAAALPALSGGESVARWRWTFPYGDL